MNDGASWMWASFERLQEQSRESKLPRRKQVRKWTRALRRFDPTFVLLHPSSQHPRIFPNPSHLLLHLPALYPKAISAEKAQQ